MSGLRHAMRRMRTLPALVLLLGIAAIPIITVLQQRSDASRAAQVKLEHLGVEFNQAQLASVAVMFGVPPALIKGQIAASKQQVIATIDQLQAGAPTAALAHVKPLLDESFTSIESTVDLLHGLTSAKGRAAMASALTSNAKLPPQVEALLAKTEQSDQALTQTLTDASSEYAARASTAKAQATVGSVAAILLLLVAFALTYRRSVLARAQAEMLATENAQMAAANRHEAITDSLTGLPNRRALTDALEEMIADPERTVALALFDLDGFKLYNDSFGHPAGDVLLTRLGERLSTAVAGSATAFRMGGDEFCVLATADREGAEQLAQRAAEALSEQGEAFAIGCSYGLALVPAEADSAEAALRLADQRMYEQKAGGRRSASRQTTDVLLQVLSEQRHGRGRHVNDLGSLASLAAERLDLADEDIDLIHLAAQLHDVGKSALPDAILNKPGSLTADEWEFMRRHPLIGERIVLAAPSLAHIAPLVRASHERIDGGGYPDGLRGDEIPLGARIIAVCDAFDAMIEYRPYRQSRTVPMALEELRRCAGTQFDARVVEVLCTLAEERESAGLQVA